ncbi:substrate-binding domain-containing protein [Lachnoclostridium phytofermentans]|uniref:substrate-binding domain-containing protein n=1 Tax=Lachnoclostridium phytofermentans TaxID=66219 RepID=UPI000689A334|nr:substrate-binding domain-containing protein [Lachnoclostridium phytofermentans]
MKHKKVFLISSIMLLTLCLVFLIYIRSLEKPKPYYMICIPKVLDDSSDFWRVLVEGVQMAALEYEVKLEFMAPEKEEDFKTQNTLIEEAIKRKPDVILLAAADYEKTYNAAKEIKDTGIKLVIIDSGMKQEIADITVATDNIQAGIRVGAVTKKLVQKDGKIGVISFVKNSKTAMDREEGLKIGLSDDSNKIEAIYYCDSNYDKAYDGTVELLTDYPDISVLVGLNQYSAVGAARAIKDMAMDTKVKLVGIDSSMEQIQYLEEGIFEAIVVQKPFNIGYLGVEKALKLLNGDYVPKQLDSGCALITKDNMFIGMNQKLIFPFNEE